MLQLHDQNLTPFLYATQIKKDFIWLLTFWIFLLLPHRHSCQLTYVLQGQEAMRKASI